MAVEEKRARELASAAVGALLADAGYGEAGGRFSYAGVECPRVVADGAARVLVGRGMRVPACLSLCRGPYCCVLPPVPPLLPPVVPVPLPLLPEPPLLLDSTLVVR